MIELIVDRIEYGVAVCETEERERYRFPAARLPAGATEGSCLELYEDGSLILAKERTAVLRQRVIELSRSLFTED